MKFKNYQSTLLLIFALLALPFIGTAQNQTAEGLPNPFQVVKNMLRQNNYNHADF